MYGIYANIGGIWMGSMLPYIAAPWIRHGYVNMVIFFNRHSKKSEGHHPLGSSVFSSHGFYPVAADLGHLVGTVPVQ